MILAFSRVKMREREREREREIILRFKIEIMEFY